MKLSSRTIYLLVVTSYAIVLVPFVDAGLRNYLTLSVAILGGVSILVQNHRIKVQFLLAGFLLTMMTISILLTSPASGLFSVALSAVYATGYFAVIGTLQRIPDGRELTLTLLRNLIFAFALVSLIQMIASLTGLPVPNVLGSKGMWSYPSLTMEPSHLGRVAGITMLSYLVLSRKGSPGTSTYGFLRENSRVILAFLTTMLLSGSALAFLAIIVVFSIWRSIAHTLILIAMMYLAIPMLSHLHIEGLERSVAFVSAFASFNVDNLVEADPSGAVRVIPLILFVQDASPWSFSFWFGGGAEAIEQTVAGRIPGVPDDQIMAGFVPGYMILYGMIASALFIWTFAIFPLRRSNASIVLFWLIFFTTSSWNSQVFWYGLMMIQVVKIALKEGVQRPVGVGY